MAVIPVILFHAGFEAFSGGFVGVDVFFVISGYLITTILIKEMDAGGISLPLFYERRARRILPALFTVMLSCFPLVWLWMPPGDISAFSRSLLSVLVFSSNILFFRESGYFDSVTELKPLLHTWSLAVEEQYYMLFPVLLMLCWRMGRRRVLILLALLWASSLALAQWGSRTWPAAAFYLLPTRAWELLTGAFAAFLLSGREAAPSEGQHDRIRRLRNAGGWLGIMLILYAVLAYGKSTPFPGLHALVPTFGAALVILCARPGTSAARFMGHPALVGIGLISYSAYLWHQPLFAFARHRSLVTPSPQTFAALSVLTLVLAGLSWRFVERPFRDASRIGTRQIFILSVTASLVMALVGMLGHVGIIGAARFGSNRVASLDNLAPAHECVQGFRDQDPVACVLGQPDSDDLIIAMGDSHMGQWADALDRIGRDRQIRIELFAKGACANASIEYFYADYGKTYTECTRWRERVVAEIARRKPKVVLMTQSSAGYVKTDGRFPNVEDWRTGVSHLVRDVTQAGPRLLWLLDNPRFGHFDPLRCYQDLTFFGRDRQNGCSSDRATAIRQAIVDAETQSVRQQAGTVIDFMDFYCSDHTCHSIAQGLPLMRDSNHLTRNTTLHLKDRLEKHLLSSLGRASIDVALHPGP